MKSTAAHSPDDWESWEERDQASTLSSNADLGAPGKVLALRLGNTKANGSNFSEDIAPTLDDPTRVAVMSIAGNDHSTGDDETPPLKVSEAYGGQLISSAEASPARTSPSPAPEEGLPASDPGSSSSSPESLTLFAPPEADAGSFWRTCLDCSPAMEARTSQSSWVPSRATDPESWGVGEMPDGAGDPRESSPGGCWTHATSECPSDGAASSSLPDVLEADVPRRFSLSPRAAAGILRRAEKRGRELPRALAAALQEMASQHRADEKSVESLGSEGMPPRMAPGGVRRLSPTECERLQGFPDGWTWVP